MMCAGLYKPAKLDEKRDDAKGGNCWEGEFGFTAYFNNPDVKVTHAAPGNTQVAFDLEAPRIPVTTEALKAAWGHIKSLYTAAFTAWSASGQGDATNFWNFCNGNSVLLYFFLSLGGADGDASHSIALRSMPQLAQGEMGGDGAPKKRATPPSGQGGPKATSSAGSCRRRCRRRRRRRAQRRFHLTRRRRPTSAPRS